MGKLLTNLHEIKRQKDEYIIPDNIKKDVEVLGIVGDLESGYLTKDEYDYTINKMKDILGIHTQTDFSDLTFITRDDTQLPIHIINEKLLAYKNIMLIQGPYWSGLGSYSMYVFVFNDDFTFTLSKDNYNRIGYEASCPTEFGYATYEGYPNQGFVTFLETCDITLSTSLTGGFNNTMGYHIGYSNNTIFDKDGNIIYINS